MSRRPARARLFVALDVPGSVRDGLAAWAAGETEGRDGLRLLDAASLHVTLCFIGWREEADVETIARAVTPCAGAAPALEVAEPAWLPPRRPGVLAVDLADPEGTLGALQRSVSDALVRAIDYEPESRPFRPHVTVARVPRRARVRPFELVAPEIEPFSGSALTLYRSRLGPAGARYEPVERVSL